MINYQRICKIKKDKVKLYNSEKSMLPCWNCLVQSTCFNEKPATKKAKYLRYTVTFTEPCLEANLVMDLIEIPKDYHEFSLKKMNGMKIEDLFRCAVRYFHAGSKHTISSYLMFIKIIQKDPNYISTSYGIAHYYLGNIMSQTSRIENAIELYTKAIDLEPEYAAAIEERGFC